MKKLVNKSINDNKECIKYGKYNYTHNYIFHKKKISNLKYDLSKFIVGKSNELTYSLCISMIKNIGTECNPLFIFGPSGVGKTHLLKGISIFLKKKYYNIKIIYITAEEWVSLYIKTIKERNFDFFRKKYRHNCDLFLVDDIQFLEGKNASQNEFFYTLDFLYQSGKQVIITSNKSPYETLGLNRRLRERLLWGLVSNIGYPEFNMRLQALKRGMIKYKIKLNYDILNYIASKVTHSIRKLEGVMLTLDAIRDLYEIEVFSFDFVIKFLSPILKKNKNYPLPEDICLAVSRFFKINKIELKGKNRTKNISNARHLAIYLCRNMLNMSLKEIGFLFGKRDHTTIISSIKRTKKKLSLESEMKEIIELIIKNIKTKNSLSF